MSDPEGLCETCAAFVRVRTDERLGKVGECALEVFRGPLKASSTCTRYRPKGASAAAPRPRAAGEPRRVAASTPVRRDDPAPVAPARERALPKEIDIDMDIAEFRRVLREVLSEELGVGDAPMGQRWQGGDLVLKPGREGTQDKRVPLDTFFHKIVMVRDKLRLLEAKINAHEGLSDEDKVQLQSYITGCYGSLTTFNVLFSEKHDHFSGQGGKDE
jgi:hypothetical protein